MTLKVSLNLYKLPVISISSSDGHFLVKIDKKVQYTHVQSKGNHFREERF